jgi:hypothetical protein
MKQLLNVLLAAVFILNQFVSVPAVITANAAAQTATPPVQTAPPVSQTPTATPFDYGAYPAPVTPTPAPTAIPTATTPTVNPTSTPTTVPTPVSPTPTPTATPTTLASRLSLATSNNCGVIDQDLSLNWNFQASAEFLGRERLLSLVLTFPSSFTPNASLLQSFNASTGELRLSLANSGQTLGQFSSQGFGLINIPAKVVFGARTLVETSLQLARGKIFSLPSSGGTIASPDGRLKVTIPSATSMKISLYVLATSTGQAISSSH